jgi:hypothetical protein
MRLSAQLQAGSVPTCGLGSGHRELIDWSVNRWIE